MRWLNSTERPPHLSALAAFRSNGGHIIVAACALAAAPIAQAAQELSQAADDPTAALMNVQLSDWYTADYHNLNNESSNQVVLRSATPFKIGNQQHIFRVTAPIITDSPFQDSGLSDMTVFDLMTFDKEWGRWGAGVVALLPTGGSDRGSEKWAVGPALGFTIPQDKLLWGVFNQNIFTVAGDDDRDDVNLSILQPIINYGLGNGWSVGASEMNVTYDWDSSEFSSLPLGLKLARMYKLGDMPVQLNGQYEYNFVDDNVSSAKSTLRFTAKFLFPAAF